MDILWIMAGLLVLVAVFAVLQLFTCGLIGATGIPTFPCVLG